MALGKSSLLKLLSKFFYLNIASSTEAETYIIITALLTVPHNSTIEIFTDSQNVIDTYNRMITRSLSIRRSLKLPNHVAWRFIIYLIESKNLKITFHKVKAHSGDQYNDLADEPANSACLLPPIELNSSKFSGTLMTPIWASLGPIDRDI
ncbi:unnamed protein product [Rhizophagus irregularis]|nr:unnamed protein product [Rhizophagus irregularis]